MQNVIYTTLILVMIASVTMCTKTVYPPDRTADLEIAKIVVWGKTLPDDFTPLGVDRTIFTSVFHMKSKRFDPTAEKQFELSTDDYNTAMLWEQTIAATYPVYTPILMVEETDLYYDVLRSSNTSFLIIYNRVFKKSAFDRDGVDLDNPDGYYGKINTTPLTTSVVERVVEYMWYFQQYNRVGSNKVISSEATENEFEIIHTLVEASRDPSFDLNNIGVCMEITVYETEYVMDKVTKELWESPTTTRTFYAKRRDPGVIIDLCEGP